MMRKRAIILLGMICITGALIGGCRKDSVRDMELADTGLTNEVLGTEAEWEPSTDEGDVEKKTEDTAADETEDESSTDVSVSGELVNPDENRQESTPVETEAPVDDETFTVPEMVGLPSDKVMSMLTAYDFELASVTYEYSDEISEGVVMYQFPQAGKTADNGTELTLIISKGKNHGTVEVPDVTGMKAADAEKLLSTGGFLVINKASSSDTLITYQNYVAGDMVKSGTQITIK